MNFKDNLNLCRYNKINEIKFKFNSERMGYMGNIGYIAKKISKMNLRNFFRVLNELHIKTRKSRRSLASDMMLCAKKFLAGYMDYKMFDMYDLSDDERKIILTSGKNNCYVSKLNPKKYINLFHEKVLFNEHFSSFLGRSWICLTENNYDDFEIFLQGKKKVIVKPLNLCCGQGIEVINTADYTAKELYDFLLKTQRTLVEEIVIQADEMNEIYPCARKTYNTENSNQKTIYVSGISSYAAYLDETKEDGSQTRIPSVNCGKLTIDLEKNNFNPESYTTYLNNESYMTYFRMMGTGVGGYNENYGEFSFIPFTKQYQSKVNLSISGCGTVAYLDWYSGIINCKNYSDISLDTTNAPYCLQSVSIRGIGYNSYNPSNVNQNYKFYDNINFGDIAFSGKVSNTLTIYTLGSESGNVQNNINLGNVTITPDSQIYKLNVSMYYNQNNNRAANISSMMNGWYDGCTIPEALNTEENQKIFEKLDKNKRYGKITISGSYNNVSISSMLFYQNNSSLKATEIINNGEITVTNIISNGISIYGLSAYNIEESQNYAPITLKNAYLKGNVYLVGAASGKRNINYADITAENCVTRVGNVNTTLRVYGVAKDSSTAENLENRGKLTVKNLHTATVNGTEYLSTSLNPEKNVYDAAVYIAGIGNVNAENCVNFGDIYVENVVRYRIGGISVEPSSSNSNLRCINYGSFVYDISIDLPAGYTYDVIVLSEEKDGAQVLADSHNGFDGKQLILSSSDEQNLDIRIILKRDTSNSIWGVQYIWNFSNASYDKNGYVNSTGGGYFNNYVYNITT